jgi:hypothetical protein
MNGQALVHVMDSELVSKLALLLVEAGQTIAAQAVSAGSTIGHLSGCPQAVSLPLLALQHKKAESALQ